MTASSSRQRDVHAELEYHQRRVEELSAELAVQPSSRLRAVRDAEPMLQSGELPLVAIADRRREVFCVFDVAEQRVTEVSPAFEAIWGRPREALLADRAVLADGVLVEDRASLLAAQERQAAGEVTELWYRVARPDGSLRWVWDRAFPITDEHGAVTRVIGLLVDVTEQRAAAEELRRTGDELGRAHALLDRASRAKDEFLSAMSHELRTPLNAVLGACEALREGVYGDLNDPQQTIIGRVEESGRRLLAVVNAVLDFSGLAAGGVALDRRPVPIEDLCRSALGQVRDAAQKKNLRVGFEVTDGFVPVIVDAPRFIQALVHLLSNAVKFTTPGGAIGLLAVVDAAPPATGGDAPRRVARFTVWDTGVGIASADLPRLFRPFVQLDAGLSRRHGGTGLGLAITQLLVELHGGRVQVETRAGDGSRFIVEIPV